MSSNGASGLTGRASSGRKLIAIVHADMVGYSRLIGLDDIGTLSRLQTLRRTLIDPAVVEHGGWVVQTAGDSLLIVFDSIEGAVRCAVAIQQQVPEYDRDQPADRAIRFRIGINIGDVIADGMDLHGDGVNVAARLQAECPTGGICVSRAVRDHVHDRLDLAFEALGALNLKNIVRPVEAFVLRNSNAATTSPRSAERPLGQSTSEPSRLLDKPSIAVLAFTNMSGDSNQEYFSDGVADDIITELSRNRSLFVIARNSSFIYKGRAVDVKLVARELGVRYVVEGSVRRDGSRVRITAQLIDAESGSHMWAERFNRDLADIFAVQDEITRAVTVAIEPAISHAERQRALKRLPEHLGAWEAYQRALWHWSKQDSTNLTIARNLIQQAVELDPRFAQPHAVIAWLYLSETTLGVGLSAQESVKLAEAEARTAVTLDPDNAIGHAMLAWAFDHQGELGLAQEEADIAVSLNPNDPYAQMTKGRVLVLSGRITDAQEPLTTALRLDPQGPTAPTVLHHLGISSYFQRNYAAAEAMTRRTIRSFPDFPRPYPVLAAALGQLGRTDEARAALDAAIVVSSSHFKTATERRMTHYRPEDHEHLLDGLRKAGWKG
jgi:adenylate cyclase